MVNGTRDGTRDMPEDGAGVDIAAAALALGISPQAVRKRVRRGSLQAYKLDGEWRVILPAVQGVGRATDYTAAQDAAYDAGYAEGRATAPDAGYATGHAASTPPEATSRELIDQLKAENDFLRRQVEHQTAIIAGLTQRLPLPLLSSGEGEGIPTAPPPTEAPRSRWAFWRRR